MALSKSLLLKGLAGVAAVGGVATGGAVAVNSGWLGGGDNGVADLRGDGKDGELGKFSHKELIERLGLSCQLTGKELKESEDKECKVKDNGTLNIKIDDRTEEGVTFTTSDTAKLKVGRSKGGVREESKEATETYSRGLKFVVDSGDITLTKKEGGGNPTTTQKLEQFETYEIKKEGDKFYLSRKTKAKEGIKDALGLGELTLPDAGGSDTGNSYGDAGKIKKIRFEGHDEGISVTAGSSITLKVSSTVDTTTFPYGYRFNFTFPGDQTINGKQLKGKIPYEFKIKKGTGNSLTLEQAWTDDNTFTKKAGLDCSTNQNECSVSTDSQKLNVKVGHQKKVDITNITGSGKIKMEKEQEGYNHGLKFSITSGDATLSGGTGEDITKLEELETYEITEYGGKYYLTKKTSPDDLIKKTLSLPDECKLPGETSVECTLIEENFKKINFEGKDTGKPTGTATLTISKGNSTDFPFGYKFTFSTTSEATIKTGTVIKANIPTDFKIKKGTASGTSTTLSLEKAWDDSKYSLAAKVGLECTAGSDGTDKCCTKSSGSSQVKLNVKKGNDVKTDIDSVSTSSTAKIKVEKDKEGYNQGLKFTITGGDVTLTGGSGGTFTTLEELETYEITEDKGKYYLTRKTSKEDVLKTSLSIPKECFTSLGTSCSLTSDNFKNINFDGKDSTGPSLSSGNATLTITKTSSTDFPLGYRFTFNTTSDATIKSGTTTIKANIPTDFKIKKGSENNGTPSLSLEKAWTDGDYSFAKKAGLECTNSECCTKSGSEQLNIKKGDEKKENITSFAAASGSSAKIKVEKDQAGYNQGLKFTVTGGNISLTGGSGTGTFTTLDEYETYEIKEDGGKYYLTRKTEASETIGDLLGLKGAGCSLSTSSASCTLSTEQIKKINFEGKDTTGPTMSTGTATLTIAKAGTSDFPLGYKFTLQSDSSDITIKSNTNTVKAKIPTEFKIKKAEGQTPTLSLEKAWTAESLGKKVGLTCNDSNNNGCTVTSGGSQLNIKKDSDKKEGITSISAASGSSAKIKVEKDQEGYNYGLKFYIDGGDVNLTGGTETKSSSSKEDLSTLEEYETYEIKEEGGKWYLARKHESIVFLKKQLGIESFCSDDTWSRYTSTGGSTGTTFNITFSCETGNLEHLKKIKFNSKNDNFSWPTGSINLLLEMKRQKGNTAGINKYGEIEVTISDNRGGGGNSTSLCIPDGSGGKIDIKGGGSGSNKSGASYKIKKSGSGSNTTLCLEKKSGSSSGGQCK